MKKVLVIIPTYNETENIDQVISEVEKVAHKSKLYNISILVVDDKSPDGTAKIVKYAQKRNKNIYLLSARKAGLGKALIRGMKFALKQNKYDAIITMDGDMSHNPADIPALLKALNGNADYVIGSRYTSGGNIDNSWPFSRRLISRIANFVARKLIGIDEPITDLTGGFKAIRVSALRKIDLDSLNVSGYVFQVRLLHAFLSKGLVVCEVPITFFNRMHGTSKLKTKDIVEFVYRAYKLNADAPLQRIVRFGFVGACGSLVNLFVLALLVKFARLDAQVAVVIAIEVSIIFNFFLNHIYTFKGYGSYSLKNQKSSIKTLLVKLGKFNVGALGGAAISFTVFSILYKYGHLNYILADILAILAAMSWNYYMSTRFVWKAIDKEA